MSDLVERLRQKVHVYDGVGAVWAANDLREAAAEIERLTAALASEREACALVGEAVAATCVPRGACCNTALEVASAIRARGKEI